MRRILISAVLIFIISMFISGCGTEPVCGDNICTRDIITGDELTGDGTSLCVLDCGDYAQQTCTDSDGGQEIFLAGTTSSSGSLDPAKVGSEVIGTFSDECLSDPATGQVGVKEFYCDAHNLVAMQLTECSLGCNSGACIAPVGSLEINSNQADSWVFIDGNYVGATLLNEMTSQGNHNIRVAKQGFSDYIQTVSVVTDQVTSVNAVLNAATGTGNLYISSNPQVAYIYIDGVAQGANTPNSFSKPTGAHFIRLTKSGYLDKLDLVTLQDGATLDYNPVLTQIPSGMGGLTVLSNTVGAEVFVDDNPVSVGVTPLSMPMSAGSHLIRVSKAGKTDYVITSSIDVGVVRTVTADLNNLAAGNGNIYISSNPQVAYIYIDGVAQGANTPKTFEKIAGTHTVRLTKSGYLDNLSNADIEAGKTTVFLTDLAPIPSGMGGLTVLSNTVGAEVFVDDNPVSVGVTPLSMPMSAGSHLIRVSKAGKTDYVITSNINAGSVLTITANLNNLAAGNGNIYISSNPQVAYIYIDGVAQGANTPKTFEKIAGTHTVRLTKSGFADYTNTSVNVISGETTVLLPVLS